MNKQVAIIIPPVPVPNNVDEKKLLEDSLETKDLTYFYEYVLLLDDLKNNYRETLVKNIPEEKWVLFEEYETFPNRGVTQVNLVLFYDNSGEGQRNILADNLLKVASVNNNDSEENNAYGEAHVVITATTEKGNQFILTIPDKLVFYPTLKDGSI